MKKAAVIGATGYVGSNIVARLLSAGYSVSCGTRNAANAAWLSQLPGGDACTFHEFDLGPPVDAEKMDALVSGCSAVYFAAGFEKQEPATITFMVESALAVIQSARRQGCECVVLTSSGGSTNPPGLDPAIAKNEVIHWSEAEVQKAAGKFSPAAKTMMETAALAEVGRDQSNEVVNEAKAEGAPRLVIMNPNLILGPQLQPGPISGNSLVTPPTIPKNRWGHTVDHTPAWQPWVCKILKGERMNEKIPNDSMSIIDVRDLANLHVAAAEKPDASGRYWGVNRSWPWEDILGAFEEVAAPYKAPPRFEGEAALPTQFDHTRKNSLGVELRSLKETLQDLVTFLRERGAI